jgi:hypothetical protein
MPAVRCATDLLSPDFCLLSPEVLIYVSNW